MLNHSLAGRVRLLALVAVLAAVLAPFAGVAPARAEAPFRLDEQITDRVDALGDRRAEAQAAVDKLRADTGLQLFVVFVGSFDGLPAQQWAEQTAALSSLGTNDALLAVATQDRAYAYNVDSSSKLSNEQLDDVAARDIEPALAESDWAGAVIAAANGYADELGGGSSGLVILGLVCLVVVLAAVGVGIWLAVRASRRRTAGQRGNAPGPTGPSTQELTDRANAQLLEMDDALRTSERDLSMATDQYGADATAPFAAALERARAEIGEAFRLRMLLESGDAADGAPTDETGRRNLLSQIIAHCDTADATLDEQADAFHELRELESRVESESAALAERRDRARARVPEAEATLSALRARYTPDALSAVAANPEQAAERLAFASSALDTAATELASGDRPQAAVAVQAAEQALDQTETLLDAIARTGTDLDAARANVDGLLTEVDADLAAARAAAGTGTSEAAGALAAAVSGAEQAAAAARTALAASTMDPLAVSRQLQDADAALDRALADVRDAQERTARARAMLDQAIAAARAEIAAASDYVTTRRGAVLQQARTLLAEAQRHLSLAESLAGTDPVTALAEARQADSLAEQAGRAARSDVDSWTGGGGGGFAGPRPGVDAGLGGLAGAVLGGILIGGARRGGGFGGGGFGGGGFGGGGFGGGGFGGGGFGGGGFRGGGGSFGGHSTGGFGGSGRRGGGGRF